MFFKTISYLKFIFNSTNQHGVHSPFVYSFVTKGLYSKNKNNKNVFKNLELNFISKKEQKVLLKIVNYFHLHKITHNTNSSSFNLNKIHNNLIISEIKHKYVDDFKYLDFNDILIIHGIYQNKKSNFKWLEMIKKKEATVTIDLFYFGLIFFRTEQAKEHFIIRS
ncbi:hypothetical protein [Polaribacter sp.]|uniref:hypothetical protein n=1 Tax=Polaribacter sp. TaxID=1920175 RepID=UPI003EF1BD83